ncbi:MAG: imidazole glycerol phosphate synthase subunit HisH [Rhodospirillales bacterium]|nr:imidazole glycerol phosphate synthase subunit HisH [Rhodospirillales bacterium]MSP79843.1 imidazole glycerol phosphate synthase subunit HisH [Rhodospirillales bacterium]
MIVAIVDYGSGNLRSAAKAFERAAADQRRAADIRIVRDSAEIARADRIVLPGVGAFADCMKGLESLPGMVAAMEDAVRRRGRPFLGICVGMQLLSSVGFEHGRHAGLGWIPGEVKALAPSDPALKIPHMGWNTLEFRQGRHPLLAGIAPGAVPPVGGRDMESAPGLVSGRPSPPGAHFYFVHSYAMNCREAADVAAETSYGGPVAALIARENMAGTQFHPEKSQAAGLRLIANFLAWSP